VQLTLSSIGRVDIVARVGSIQPDRVLRRALVVSAGCRGEVVRALDDWDGGRQHRDVVDVSVLQLLAGAEPHDLHLLSGSAAVCWLSSTH